MTFAVLFKERAKRDLDDARVRAFDDTLAQILEQLEVLPEMGPPAFIRGKWSKRVRKLTLGRTGYLLYYSLHARAGLIEVRRLWHEKQRPPRL